MFSDIDECTEHLSSCNQFCTNKHCLEGRYNCSCEEGFYLSLFDNSTCLGNNCKLKYIVYAYNYYGFGYIYESMYTWTQISSAIHLSVYLSIICVYHKNCK